MKHGLIKFQFHAYEINLLNMFFNSLYDYTNTNDGIKCSLQIPVTPRNRNLH